MALDEIEPWFAALEKALGSFSRRLVAPWCGDSGRSETGRPYLMARSAFFGMAPPAMEAYRKADPGEADERTIIDNLISGRYSHPQRVLAISLMEDFALDVTTDVALKVLKRAIAQGWKLPKATRELVERAIDTDVPAEVRE